MNLFYETPDGRAKLYLGDAIEVMASFPDACVDAIVTDPPYGLEFMGKEWDRFQVGGEPWSEKRTTSPDWNRRERDRQSTAYPRATHKRCRLCGKQEFSGSPCRCVKPDWEVIASQPRQLRAYQSWTTAWATEAYRILKPGAYMLVMGGTRTHHRLGCGLEDAGLEIRDELAWIYASGFPKNYDVSKGIDKKAGAEREVVGQELVDVGMQKNQMHAGRPIKRELRDKTVATTPEAQYWQGYGTALKPAHESIWLVKKPNEGTYVDNVLEHGCGAMNIDGSRIATEDKLGGGMLKGTNPVSEGWDRPWRHDPEVAKRKAAETVDKVARAERLGRWPANVIVDCYPEEFQGGVVIEGEGKPTSGKTKGFHNVSVGNGNIYHGGKPCWTIEHPETEIGNGLLGPYTRFFVIPKPSKSEKTCGGKVENKHVTVKPVRLGMWLIKLITPHQHPVIVADLFCGSGSFLVSGLRLNQEQGYQIEMWGIDKDEQSVETTRERLKAERTLQGVLL